MDILHRQCSWCRRVYRDGQWVKVALDQSVLNITHGLCPECAKQNGLDSKTPSERPPDGPQTAG